MCDGETTQAREAVPVGLDVLETRASLNKRRLDALPFFGTGTVLIPWAVILLLFRNYYAGAVLLSVYVMTYFVREIMESKCMGDRLGIAPFTMLMVIFTGIMVYGILGFILGPLSYCMMKALIRYFASVLENAGGTWYT